MLKMSSNFFKIDEDITSSHIIVGLYHSGSMSDLYVDGSMQTLLNRIYPISLINNKSDFSVYAFTEKIKKVKTDTKNFYQSLDSIHFFGWGNSVLLPFMEIPEIEKNSNDKKTLVMIFFDENFEDLDKCFKMIKKNNKIFFTFISIRNDIINNNDYYCSNLNSRNSKFISFKSISSLLKLNDLGFYKLILEPYLSFCMQN